MKHIDQTSWEELRSLDDGEGAILKQLIELFTSTTPASLTELQGAVTAKDGETIERAAHKLKSSAFSLGAMRMGELCKDLEKFGKASDIDAAALALTELQHEFNAAKAELDALPA